MSCPDCAIFLKGSVGSWETGVLQSLGILLCAKSLISGKSRSPKFILELLSWLED